MNTVKLFIAGLIIISLVSCSSNDDNQQSFDIVGSWTLTQGTIEPGTINMDMGGMQIPIEISGDFVEIDPNNQITFNTDLTFTSSAGRIVLELTMIFMSTSQTQSFEQNDVFGTGTWELNGNELRVSNDTGAIIPYYLERISDTEIVLTGNAKDMVMEDGSNPMVEGMDIPIKLRMKKN